MKAKIYFSTLFLFAILSRSNSQAQVPQAIPYQAIARDISGNPIVNQNISLRLSIHDLTLSGTIVYRETQSVTSNAFGLFSVNVGQGIVISGTFSSINWATGNKFIQVEMDALGGTAYIDMGTQQMLSVPYAFAAGNGGVDGAGTVNQVPKFTPDSASLGNSMIYDNGISVGIGTNNPHPSAILHASSTTQGFLMPVMCTAQRLAIINPAPGLMVFDSCENTMYYYTADINVGPWIPININNNSGGNTLDEAYDEGGPGAGRIITADMGAVEINTTGTNSALDISNTTANGMDIDISAGGKGITIDAETGTGLDINMHDNGNGEAITTNFNTTGKGLYVSMFGTGTGIAAEGYTADGNNLINSTMYNAPTLGSWYDTKGRAGLYSIESFTNNRPALEARTNGTGHGIAATTAAFTSTNEVVPTSGVAGMSFTSNNRNGVSGFSAGNRGVWGKTVSDAGWAAGPLTMKSGVYGTVGAAADFTSISNELIGTMGYTNKGAGVVGINEGYGYGVIGISKTSGSGLSEAGVWGNVETTDWTTFNTDYPFAEGGAASKGPLGVLAQSKATIALWAESQEKVGLVTTTGIKKGMADLPYPKSALIALSSQADATTAVIKNDGAPAFPALRIISTTAKGIAPGGTYIVDIAGSGTGGGINVLTIDPVSTMNSVNVTNSGEGFAGQFAKTKPTSMVSAFKASTAGTGSAGEFEIEDNNSNMKEALLAKTSGKGSAATFVIADATSGAPVVNASGSGMGNSGKFFNTNTANLAAAIHAETAGGSIAYFKSNLSGYADEAIQMYNAGIGTTLLVNNYHAMPGANSAASATALVVESNLGPIAHFDSKLTAASTPSESPVVLISTTSPFQMGLKVTTTGTMLADAKAAEFNGDVDITKKLTVGGKIVLGSGSSPTVIEPDKISVGELKAGSISLYGVPVLTVFGSMHVAGTLTKAGGTFKIDHPLDPYNKYLYHSFVESPDMMNIYNGNITTNDRGFATVELPAYFESLNIEFRYQLTVIGTFANAIISKKIEGNKFVIQTDKPEIEVSWQVTGVRNDEWAKHNRVIPEVEKEEANKGTLLYKSEFTE